MTAVVQKALELVERKTGKTVSLEMVEDLLTLVKECRSFLNQSVGYTSYRFKDFAIVVRRDCLGEVTAWDETKRTVISADNLYTHIFIIMALRMMKTERI